MKYTIHLRKKLLYVEYGREHYWEETEIYVTMILSASKKLGFPNSASDQFHFVLKFDLENRNRYVNQKFSRIYILPIISSINV